MPNTKSIAILDKYFTFSTIVIIIFSGIIFIVNLTSFFN